MAQKIKEEHIQWNRSTISTDGSNDRAEEEETIRLEPAVDLKEWVIKNFLTIGGALHNSDHDHIAELLHDDETF